MGLEKLLGPPFWAALRARVVPARKLRKFYVMGIPKGLSMSDVEPLGQLRGSLEVLGLHGCESASNPPSGLRRFPESFLGLTNLKKLAFAYYSGIKAIPAGIANLKKLTNSPSPPATFARCRKSWARSRR